VPQNEIDTPAELYGVYVGYRMGYGKGSFIGLHAAYFFNSQLGAGIICAYTNYKTDYFNFRHLDEFYCPSFLGHWGYPNSKFYFPTIVGLGYLKHYRSDYNDGYNKGHDIGLFLSAGIAYKFTRQISTGFNYEYFISGNSLSRGFSLGLNLHF